MSSFDVGTPAFDWARMKSSRPTLSNSRWAVGVSKTEIVAPPIDWTEEKSTIPEMRNLCSAPREVTPIESPILKCFLSAVLLSIATSSGPDGQLPAFRVSGLKRWSPCGSTLEAMFGAPPVEIDLPLLSTNLV